MKKVYKANLYFLTILILEIILPMFLGPIYRFIRVNDIRVMLLMNHIIIFLIPAIMYIVMNKLSFRKTLKLNKLHFKDLLLIIILGFVVQPIMSFFSIIAAFFFNNEIGGFIGQITSTPYLILLSLVAVLPAITEEVTIRGIVLSGYEEKNKYIAAVVTGIFFGILHLDPQQFLYAVVLGFILALVVRITNSIFAAAIMHFIINGTSVTISKVISIFQGSEKMAMDLAETSLRALSINEKISLLVVYGGIAFVFATIVFIIIKKLEELNARRVTINENSINTKTINIMNQNDDKIVNGPLIAIMIIYIVFMGIKILI